MESQSIMAAPADSSTTTAATTTTSAAAGPPLPRAIQLLMAIPISPTTRTGGSTKTIGDWEHYEASRGVLWALLVSLPPLLLASAAAITYAMLHDDDGAGELISLAGLGFLAVPVLLFVYIAVVLAAWFHLGLFAPRMPIAAWDALFKVGLQWMVILLGVISLGPLLLPLCIYHQAWLPPAAWAFLLGLLVASAVAFWLCLLRTYGGGGGGGERQYLLLGGGERRGKKSSCSCGEAVIDGLAYPYARLLYEVAVRVPYEEIRRIRTTDAVQQADDAAAVV